MIYTKRFIIFLCRIFYSTIQLMTERIPMNSRSIQSYFYDVYQDFFSKTDLVTSGCFAYPWGPIWGKHTSNYIRLKTKLPIKCYVGVKKRTDREVIFSKVCFYSIATKTFEYASFGEINKEEKRLQDAIRWYLDSSGYEWWIEISILSEATRGHSLGFSGTSFAALSWAIHVLIWTLTVEELNNHEDIIVTPAWKKIHLFAWRLEMLGRYWNTPGHNILNALARTKHPTLLTIERFEEWFDILQLHKIAYEHIDIQKKFPSTSLGDDSFLDYHIVYSGVPTRTKQLESIKKATSHDYNAIRSFIDSEILTEKLHDKDIYVKKFLTETSIYDTLSDTICILNIKTVQLFKEMYERGYDEQVIDRFIAHINEYRYIANILGETNVFTDDFLYFFRKHRKNSAEIVSIMPAYSWKLLWWGFIVVTKYGLSRATIQKALSELRDLYTNIELEYASYLDGDENGGIVVEQYLSKQYFSGYIKHGKYLATNNRNESYVAEYKEIIDRESEWLLLDAVEWKIYFNWEKLTSKDIPSQNTTVDILVHLLPRQWEEISNKDFPSSSYSKNKNDMLGKIIIPLARFIEEKTGSPFPLMCKGWLNDFYVKLNSTHIKITKLSGLL